MAKAWVITLEPTDKSGPQRLVETISSRKKIGEVEEYLCFLFRKLVPSDKTDLQDAISRHSGTVTALEKGPYIFHAELVEI